MSARRIRAGLPRLRIFWRRLWLEKFARLRPGAKLAMASFIIHHLSWQTARAFGLPEMTTMTPADHYFPEADLWPGMIFCTNSSEPMFAMLAKVSVKRNPLPYHVRRWRIRLGRRSSDHLGASLGDLRTALLNNVEAKRSPALVPVGKSSVKARNPFPPSGSMPNRVSISRIRC